MAAWFGYSSWVSAPQSSCVGCVLLSLLLFVVGWGRLRLSHETALSPAGVKPSQTKPIFTNSSTDMQSIHLDLKIQIASDLHLEFYGDSLTSVPDDVIVPKAPVLALLGDVGLAGTDILRDFLYQQAERFEQVLFVAGNHEYYNHRGKSIMTVMQQRDWMKEVCSQKPNLHFMERVALEINGVVILGTTLWSHVPDYLEAQVQSQMNDYHVSYVDETHNMQVRHTNAEFKRNRRWLQTQIEGNATKPILVLTHHTPSMHGTSHPQYDDSELSHAFSTNMTDLLQKPNVKAWACGHTHYNFNMIVDDTKGTTTRLLSNQRGYPGNHETKDYEKDGVVLRIKASL